MKRCFAIAFMFVAIVFANPVENVGAVEDPVTCFDNVTQQYLTATKWLTSPGTLIGTSKRDVLVGSSGADVIKGMGGNDVICSSFFVEETLMPGEDGLDTIDPGSGNDSVLGNAIVKASSGNDFIRLSGPDAVGNGGSGSDTLLVNYGKAFGGSGNDLVLGYESQVLDGGSGNDVIENGDGDPRIDCGSGRDNVVPRQASIVVRCEFEETE